MSGWERNEVVVRISEKIAAVVTDPDTRAEVAELAASVFIQVGSNIETVETTTFGSPEERAIRQRFVVARFPVGEPEHLTRPRQTGWRTA